MKYVCFMGTNPSVDELYEDYLAFEDDTPISEIEFHSINYALENAKKYAHMTELSKDEYYTQCVKCSGWKFVTEKEFINSLS